MRLPVLITLVFVTFFLLLVIVQPYIFHTYSLTIIDDGYYYLGYAQNIAQGNGPTFDGIVETNGVQPLWALLLIGLASVVSDPLSFVYLSMVLALSLTLLSVVAVYQVFSHFFSGHLHSFMVIIYIGLIANPSLVLSGMETALNLCTGTLALWAILRINKFNYRSILLAGFFIGLSCLSRVDNLIITPVFALLMLWKSGLLKDLLETKTGFLKASRWILVLATPAVVMFTLYLIFNMAVFERPLPISGDIKAALHQNTLITEGGRFSVTSIINTTLDTMTQYRNILNTIFWMPLATFSPVTLLIRIGVVLLIIAATIYLIWARPFRENLRNFLLYNWAMLGICMVILFAHTWLLFFQTGKSNASVLSWYYVPEYIFILILIGIALKVFTQFINLHSRLSITVLRGFIISLGIGMLTFSGYFAHPPEVKPLNALYKIAVWTNQNLPSDAITGSFNAGIVGYFTDGQVINLDGLMNNQDILDVAKGHRTIWEYIQAQQIEYIIDYTSADWDLETSPSFKRIPMEHLELIYSQPFMDYSFKPSVAYVFHVDHKNQG